MSDYHLLLSAMALQSDGVVFFGIFYSGETREVLRLVEKVQEFGMKKIALSRVCNHKLSQCVDVLLSMARAPEAKFRSAATSSHFAQLFVINIVFLAYASFQYAFTINQLKKSRNAVEGLKDYKLKSFDGIPWVRCSASLNYTTSLDSFYKEPSS
jgi:DNA-binding MurR/RpiR family transcriptional regulator